MTSPDREAENLVWKWANSFPYKLNISDERIEDLNRQVIDAHLRARQQGRREGWEGALDVHVQRCTGCDVRSDRFCTEGKLYHHLAHQEEAR
mgnify:CR=1 FL=1